MVQPTEYCFRMHKTKVVESMPRFEAQFLRVTHPFHPLLGKEFPLADRRLTWGEDRVYYHDETAS